MSDHLPQCWTQDMGGMKRASADSCSVCHAIKFAVADALHEYDKRTYERCAGHMRTARAEALDAAREAVVALPMMKIAGNFPLYDADEVIAAIDALKEKP